MYASLGELVKKTKGGGGGGRDDLYKHSLEAVESLEGIQVGLLSAKILNPEQSGSYSFHTCRPLDPQMMLKSAALCITMLDEYDTWSLWAMDVPWCYSHRLRPARELRQHWKSWHRRIYRVDGANNGTPEGFDRESFADPSSRERAIISRRCFQRREDDWPPISSNRPFKKLKEAAQ